VRLRTAVSLELGGHASLGAVPLDRCLCPKVPLPDGAVTCWRRPPGRRGPSPVGAVAPDGGGRCLWVPSPRRGAVT
jgi:hypothetical protein